jgi:hypothetical protein
MINGFEKDNSFLFNNIFSKLDNHQVMIEDTYRSCLRVCKDYLELNRLDKAADSLMEVSNREGTPVVNYLLGICLIALGETTLGEKKLTKALNMNPLLALPVLDNNPLGFYESESAIISWSCTPYTLEDTPRNKFLRGIGLGTEINEGISSLNACSVGGNIAYALRVKDMNRSIYGCIDVRNGGVLWQRIVEEEVCKEIVLNSPLYVVYYYDNIYNVYSAEKGHFLASFTRDTFHTIFCPEILLKDERIMQFYDRDNEATLHIPIVNYSNRKVHLNKYIVREHTGTKSDGNYPHPGIQFYKYSAKNIEFILK